MTVTFSVQPLRGVRILSLALNLPGPAALLRCAAMGAQCTKLEPPPPLGQPTADPMGHYSPVAYAALHDGVGVLHAHLKTSEGQAVLHAALANADVLLTSFRPSALDKLGLGWEALHARYPQLSLVRIVGATGQRAEEPGHDLTYQAEAGLLQGLQMPPTLLADMAGSLAASEAVLQAQLACAQDGQGVCLDVGLAESAQWMALPATWGLMHADSDTGGAHAGYQMYPCADGRVAMAALEPHFAARLCEAAGLPPQGDAATLRTASTHAAIAQFVAPQTRAQLQVLAHDKDIPLYTLP
ncbi:MULTISPECIES: CoA transferase [Giesbergeria]|uniref:CoA transferase n=1 Tax=Giesbergeria sinuosa TaxID=80883 RepID=A0ABV9QD07_9BURK